MICVDEYVRITQSLGNGKYDTYTAYNSKTNGLTTVNYSCYKLLQKINNLQIDNIDSLNSLLVKSFKNSSDEAKSLTNILFENSILVDSPVKTYNKNILPPLNIKYPLTSLAFEITSKCNLNCKHCYGQYGNIIEHSSLSFEYIKSLKPCLDKLHTRSIALTGGEALIHDDFGDIATFFLSNGFRLTIFTNGYNHQQLKNFLESNKMYHITIKISLDGMEATHNKIRGNAFAYKNTLKTLEILKEYKNIDVYVATTIMRENLNEISIIDEMIRRDFPQYTHQHDLIFPITNIEQQTSSFTETEFPMIYSQYPNIFTVEKTNKGIKPFRCSGGVTSAAIDSSKYLRICAGAKDAQFVLCDLKTNDLYNTWKYPSHNARFFRREKPRSMKSCRSCSSHSSCTTINCRVLAHAYTDNSTNSSPITCFIEKGVTK